MSMSGSVWSDGEGRGLASRRRVASECVVLGRERDFPATFTSLGTNRRRKTRWVRGRRWSSYPGAGRRNASFLDGEREPRQVRLVFGGPFGDAAKASDHAASCASRIPVGEPPLGTVREA